MGITIVPKERDENSDLSNLEIKFPGGSIESPSRFITKVDLNAKDGIGADIPLSRTRKLFLYEEWINKDKIESMLTNNGYLADFQKNFKNFLSRVKESHALKLIYPKFTKGGLEALDTAGENNRNKIWAFFFQVVSEFASGSDSIDGFLVQYDHLTESGRNYIMKQNLPFIPTVDMHAKYNIVSQQLKTYASMPSSLVPFIGLNYSTFSRGNLAYQDAIQMLDFLHESGKGFITVDSPRVSGSKVSDPDVSALHYSNFIVADLVAERIYHGGSGKPKLRLFEKDDLATPHIDNSQNASEHSGEDYFLKEDEKLHKILINMFHGEVSPSDTSRAAYLSRVHENILSETEYKKMRKSISDNELPNYRTEKRRLDILLREQKRI